MKGFGSHLLSMGSKVYLIEHLDADELYHRYREEQDPIKRTHLQILWLLTSGRPAKVAAEMTGYSQRWISVLVGRYNEAGVDGLGDLRRFNPGSMLDAEQRERLDRALDDPPPDGGLWTGRAIDLLGRLVSPRRGLEYLRRLGFTRQVPRPRHARGDFAAQERFDFRARMEELAREEPGRSVQVFDEHRAGLKPVIRRVWARRGQRPRPSPVPVALCLRLRAAGHRRVVPRRCGQHGDVQRDPGRLRP
jgi:transposase